MSELQKSPRGLLGSLNLKQQGENPSQLAKELRAVFDCTDLYTVDLPLEFSQDANLTVAGDANLIVLAPGNGGTPAGAQPAAYSVNGISAVVPYDPTDTNAVYALGYARASDTHSMYFDLGPRPLEKVPAVNYKTLLSRYFERPLILLPGSLVQVKCFSSPAAARLSSLFVHCNQLP
jgi:hypothetical protein